MNKITTFMSATAAIALTATPAFAAAQVPEPGAFGLIAGAVVAMAVAGRLLRRK